MTRLGRRQRAVLEAAAAGRASAHHNRGGAFHVFGADEVYGDDVLDSLLARDLLEPGEEKVAGYELVLTAKGRAALEGP